MANQRSAIRMTPDELSSFIEAGHNLQVATIGKDGAPHLTTVWYGVSDGAILFETYDKSQKVVNLRRDPRIAVLIEDGKQYGELRGVSINGHAELIEENPRRTDLMGLLLRRHFPQRPGDEISAMAERMAAKRIVIAVHAEKVVSWDHRKLGGKGP